LPRQAKPDKRARKSALGAASCSEHTFHFDLDRAIGEQLIESLEASHKHPLDDARAPREQGIYAIYRHGDRHPLYVGKTGVAIIRKAGARTDIRGRLRQHVRTLAEPALFRDRSFDVRYLVIPERWRIVQAETVLVSKYRPPLNGTGFGSHVPGVGRPGTHRKSLWKQFVDGDLGYERLEEIAKALPLAQATKD
jgi:Eco29kI-like restriction endonuclease